MPAEIRPLAAARTIAMLSHVAPGPGTGSGIVLLRHLTRLHSEGWRIILILPEHAIASAGAPETDWRVVNVPRRLWWWPPVRAGLALSQAVRDHLVLKYLTRKLVGETVTHVVTLLWGEVSGVAPLLSEALGAKSCVIIHDQEELWMSGSNAARVAKRNARIANSAHRVFPVTERQGRSYGVPDRRICQLYPIPGSYVLQSRADQKTQRAPVLACAGSIHSWHYAILRPLADALAERAGTLLLLGADDNEVCKRLIAESRSVKLVPPFSRNADAITYVAENATAFLVAYSVDPSLQRWSLSSFPSKLLDFAFADVPAVIICSEDTELWRWARARSLPYCWSNMSPTVARHVVSELSDPNAWSAARHALRSIRESEFSADAIHGRFRDTLIDTTKCA